MCVRIGLGGRFPHAVKCTLAYVILASDPRGTMRTMESCTHKDGYPSAVYEIGVAEARTRWPWIRKTVQDGGTVYLTQRGHRRAAIVSVPVGQEIARRRRRTPQVRSSMWVRGNLASAVDVIVGGGVVMMTWYSRTTPKHVAAVVPHTDVRRATAATSSP